MRNRVLIILAYLAAVACAVLAVIYFATPANQLPSYFPGHDATSQAHHIKHGIGAALLALGCVAYAWFQGGPKSAPEQNGRDKTED
jgi:hypothetical protein